jgi:hypothetical protein
MIVFFSLVFPFKFNRGFYLFFFFIISGKIKKIKQKLKNKYKKYSLYLIIILKKI